jgi:hypothetical protein
MIFIRLRRKSSTERSPNKFYFKTLMKNLHHYTRYALLALGIGSRGFLERISIFYKSPSNIKSARPLSYLMVTEIHFPRAGIKENREHMFTIEVGC